MTKDIVEEIRLWANIVEELWKNGYNSEAISQLRKWYINGRIEE